MRPRFQADENLNSKIISGLLRRQSGLDFQTAKAGRVLGLSDFEVLTIAARDGRILVSHDHHTIPLHFRRFIANNPQSGFVDRLAETRSARDNRTASHHMGSIGI